MDSTRTIQAASKKLCEKAETHVVLSIDKVTKAIKIFGDEKSVELIVDDGPLKKRVQEIFNMWGFLKSLSEHLEIFLRSLSKEVFSSFAKGLVCQLC